MSTHIGQRLQALRLAADRALRVASRIAIELEEEAKLDRFAVARAPTVIRAVVRASAWLVHVHRVIGAGRGRRNLLANFVQHRRRADVVWQRAAIDHVALVCYGAADSMPGVVGELVDSRLVAGAT